MIVDEKEEGICRYRVDDDGPSRTTTGVDGADQPDLGISVTTDCAINIDFRHFRIAIRAHLRALLSHGALSHKSALSESREQS